MLGPCLLHGRGLTLRFALLLAALALAQPASAADFRIQLNFFTPGYAVMCWEDHHEIQFACFTPNDGFSLYMYPTGRVPRDGDEHPYSGALVKNPAYRVWKNTDFNRKTGGLLPFGNRWTEWQALKLQYSCASASTGLTCKNRSGHARVAGSSTTGSKEADAGSGGPSALRSPVGRV